MTSRIWWCYRSGRPRSGPAWRRPRPPHARALPAGATRCPCAGPGGAAPRPGPYLQPPEVPSWGPTGEYAVLGCRPPPARSGPPPRAGGRRQRDPNFARAELRWAVKRSGPEVVVVTATEAAGLLPVSSPHSPAPFVRGQESRTRKCGRTGPRQTSPEALPTGLARRFRRGPDRKWSSPW